MDGVKSMKCYAVIGVLLALAPHARAESAAPRYELSIGYELPRDANLARDAQTKEADAIEERNTANQACRPESVEACQRENEIAFRKRIAAIPQVKFWLAFKRCVGGECEPTVHPVFTLLPGEETSAEFDLRMGRLSQARRYAGIGLYADTACTVHRGSDDAVVTFPSSAELCRHQGDEMTKAIVDGDLARLRALLADGVSPDQLDDWNSYPLQVAAQVGNAEAARILLDAGANQSLPAQHDEPSALYLATAHAHIDVVRLLLDHGGTSTHAVEEAAAHGNRELAQLLIEHEQPIGNALAIAAGFGRAQLVKLLLDHGADPNAGPVLPFLAACGRNPPSVRPARAEAMPNFDGRELAETRQEYGTTWPDLPRSEYGAVLELLIRSWPDVDTAPGPSLTPVRLAVQFGNLDAVKVLVRHHAKLNKPEPSDGKLPLDVALSHHDVKLVQFLRAHGAKASR
jgi:ankyrin repeat protein